MSNRENYDRRDSSFDVAMLEAEFRKDKAKGKLNFTRSLNNLLLIADSKNLPSRSEVCDACHSMDLCMEIVMEGLSNFTSFYIKIKELQKAYMVVSEMEKIETDFSSAYTIVWACLDSLESDKSSNLSIDLERRSLINEDTETDTYRNQQDIALNQTLNKVGTFKQNSIRESINKTSTTSCNSLKSQNKSCKVQGDRPVDRVTANHCPEAVLHKLKNSVNTEKPNRNAGIFTPTDGFATPNIGYDMWTQLQPVQIPIFSGDKRSYPSWKAAFMACVDSAPITQEYKMLQLRQYVSEEALIAIENLGYSPAAYEAAKDRLERKYGGKRRQKVGFMEDLEKFQPILPGNAEELERFADLLDITTINLRELGEHQDLGDGYLYIQLQRKFPQSLLARYHRWLFENNMTESVVALQTWVLQESHFQTIASETINGLTGHTSNTHLTQLTPNIVGKRTFFIRTEASATQQIQPCQACKEQHRIWQCKVFTQKDVSERWNVAKRFQLCYRCLAEGHHGKSCPRPRRCGKNGCHKVHHRLLHLHKNTRRSADFKSKSNTRPRSTDLQHGHQRSEALSSAHITFGTEGKRYTEQRTNFTDSYFNSGKMKVENMNTRLNQRELGETIGVSPGNKTSVDTIDRQTVSSKVEEPISCEALNPYGTGLPRKSTLLRRGTSHTIPPERLECGYITDVRKTTKFKRSPFPHQHIMKFQNMAQILEYPSSRDHTGDPVETSFEGGLSTKNKRQTDTFGRQVQVR